MQHVQDADAGHAPHQGWGLATVELIGTELRAVVTYDQRMVLVAASLGLAVNSRR